VTGSGTNQSVGSPLRVLSAGNTLFFKVVPTLILLGESAYFWRRGFPWGVAMLAFPIWWAWVAAKFKRVALDDTSIHISNFIHEIVVPLHEVDRVSERLAPLRAIVLELTQNTRFGRRIEFSPLGSSHPPPPHPFVIELEIAVGTAKRAKEASAASTG
jgi:hypothetical protein